MISQYSNPIKIILAVLFFICLLDLPYGYFQFVRFVGLIGFLILAYQAYENKEQTLVITYVCLAILFQPLIKLSLGRTAWNIVDLVVGIFLIASIFIPKNK
ncbi:MAG: hypothetical protein NTX97_13280 [Bacteroidetes bacterium]|nr:hypothetical protein [Bacteroidota bacterium]